MAIVKAAFLFFVLTVPLLADPSARPSANHNWPSRTSRGRPARPDLGVTITQDFENTDLAEIIRTLAGSLGRKVYLGTEVRGSSSIRLRSAPVEAALAELLALSPEPLVYKFVEPKGLVVTTPAKLQQIDSEVIGCNLPRPPNVNSPSTDTRSQTDSTDLAANEEIVFVRYGDVEVVREMLATLIPVVRITIIEGKTPQLRLEGEPAALEQAKVLLDELDKPLAKFILECKLASLSPSQIQALSIEWSKDTWEGHVGKTPVPGSLLDSRPIHLRFGVVHRSAPGPQYLNSQSESRLLRLPSDGDGRPRRVRTPYCR